MIVGMTGTQSAHADTGDAATLELMLEPDAHAPGVARVAVAELSDAHDEHGPHISEARSQELLLLVSEIVTNAVRHTEDPTVRLTLTAEITDDAAHVAITDSGHGFGEERKHHAGGYGLFLLEKLASRWSVEPVGARASGTRVWFELPLRSRG